MSASDKAKAIVDGDRTEKYGHPFDSFSKIAAHWSVILGIPISPEDVGHCMIAFKLVRDCYFPSQENRDDLGGYTYCLEKIAERRVEMEARDWLNEVDAGRVKVGNLVAEVFVELKSSLDPSFQNESLSPSSDAKSAGESAPTMMEDITSEPELSPTLPVSPPDCAYDVEGRRW